MKALLLRVGIDKGCGGSLSPIFPDGSFAYIPIPEYGLTNETMTYDTMLVSPKVGCTLAEYLPKAARKMHPHHDPEFNTFTYGDPTSKRKQLIKLVPGDLLVFYAGFAQAAPRSEYLKRSVYETDVLCIFGYFVVKMVYNFNLCPPPQKREVANYLFPNNAHTKRIFTPSSALVVVQGCPLQSKLLKKVVRIGEKQVSKLGVKYHAIAKHLEPILSISGSIQRSIPPRWVSPEGVLELIKENQGES